MSYLSSSTDRSTANAQTSVLKTPKNFSIYYIPWIPKKKNNYKADWFNFLFMFFWLVYVFADTGR